VTFIHTTGQKIKAAAASSSESAKKVRARVIKSADFYRPTKFVREKIGLVGWFFSFVGHHRLKTPNY